MTRASQTGRNMLQCLLADRSYEFWDIAVKLLTVPSVDRVLLFEMQPIIKCPPFVRNGVREENQYYHMKRVTH